MPAAPLPRDEDLRLAVLRDLDLLDAGPDADLDRVSALVAEVLSASTAAFDETETLEEYRSVPSLQHILVMEHDGQTMVIKHWRQDWTYQPQTVLTYAGPNQWVLTPVPEAQRQGAWSQTVWQTDDSPRYGGVGRWTYDNGLTAWTSDPTWRPLARRDAVRHPIYDRYLGTNRHILTPAGWVHIQDNMKMAGQPDGAPVAVVQEDVINTYDRNDSYSPKPGDDYWAKTQGFWAAVRDAWDAAVAAHGGIHLEEVGDTGAVTGTPLMDLAQQVADGKTAEAALAALAFSPKRVAEEVRTVLESAIANAENNHQLDVDQLVVAEAYVGKSIVMKRWSPRARGRVGPRCLWPRPNDARGLCRRRPLHGQPRGPPTDPRTLGSA